MAKQFKPETLCVQAGWTPKKGEPRVLPIYQSTTFKYDTSEQMARLFDLEDSGYFYTRLQNPTNDAVAAKIAALEGGVAAMLTSSGQAANFYAIFNICQAGDHFVCSSTIYGGTFNLFGVTMKKLGVDVTFVNPDAPEEEISAAFRPNTKALFGETISNPIPCLGNCNVVYGERGDRYSLRKISVTFALNTFCISTGVHRAESTALKSPAGTGLLPLSDTGCSTGAHHFICPCSIAMKLTGPALRTRVAG